MNIDFFVFFCRLSAEDVAALIEDSEVVEADIFIQPPENSNSDCDSGEEEMGSINNLPGSQLRAECSSRIRLATGDNIVVGQDLDSESESTSDNGVETTFASLDRLLNLILLSHRKSSQESGKRGD